MSRWSLLGNDFRYAIRMLAKQPAFTLVAVLTLALGIGANSAMFSLVLHALIRPLPFPEPERVVLVWNKYDGFSLPRAALSGPDVREIRDGETSFESMAAITMGDMNLTGGGTPARVIAARSTSSLGDVLGVPPALGRWFLESEDVPDGNVVVLSDGLWRRRFGADPSMVGRTISLSGKGYLVVGVMPRGFAFPNQQIGLPIVPPDVWVPLALTSQQTDVSNRGNEYLFAVARLKRGVTPAQAQAELTRIAEAAMGDGPGFFRDNGWGHGLSRLVDDATRPLRAPLLLLFAAVGFVLLIACGNVAHLLLARIGGRRREIALRTALGADRGHIAQQFLVESVTLSLIGGAVGLWLGIWGAALVARLRMPGLPSLEGSGIDGTVVLFTLGISVLTGLLFGTLPALLAQATKLNEAIKETSLTTSGGAQRSRLRNALVAIEVALTVVLLVGAGLSIRSLAQVLSVPPGFDPRSAVTVRTSLPSDRYATPERQAAFYEQAVAAIAARPGVQAAGAIVALPLTGAGWTQSFDIPGHEKRAGGPPPLCSFRPIVGDYFRAMGIPIVRGQSLHAGAHGEIVVDEDLARRYLPHQDPLGQELELGNSQRMRIVGVVGSVKEEGLETPLTKPMVYASVTDSPIPSMVFVARTPQPAAQASADLKRAVWNLDRDLPLFDVAPLSEVVSKSVASPRARALLLGLFAALAVFLAAVGIYGLVSYGVTQRTHEIGVRVALGASPEHVLGVVIRDGMSPVLLGLGIGLVGALALSRLIQSQLYGIRATDPATYLFIALLVAIVAMAAMFVPARRALALDPVVALRYE